MLHFECFDPLCGFFKKLLSGHCNILGFPGGSDGKEFACSAGDLGLIPGSGTSPGEGNGSTPVFLPGELHGQGSLTGYSPWGCKESDTTEQLTLLLFNIS